MSKIQLKHKIEQILRKNNIGLSVKSKCAISKHITTENVYNNTHQLTGIIFWPNDGSDHDYIHPPIFLSVIRTEQGELKGIYITGMNNTQDDPYLFTQTKMCLMCGKYFEARRDFAPIYSLICWNCILKYPSTQTTLVVNNYLKSSKSTRRKIKMELLRKKHSNHHPQRRDQ